MGTRTVEVPSRDDIPQNQPTDHCPEVGPHGKSAFHRSCRVRQTFSLPPADSESCQACSERRQQHAKINYASAGWRPTTLLCNLGVMFGVAHLRIVQAEKAEHQRESSQATH